MVACDHNSNSREGIDRRIEGSSHRLVLGKKCKNLSKKYLKKKGLQVWLKW
jgi:hypothetical protein